MKAMKMAKRVSKDVALVVQLMGYARLCKTTLVAEIRAAIPANRRAMARIRARARRAPLRGAAFRDADEAAIRQLQTENKRLRRLLKRYECISRPPSWAVASDALHPVLAQYAHETAESVYDRALDELCARSTPAFPPILAGLEEAARRVEEWHQAQAARDELEAAGVTGRRLDAAYEAVWCAEDAMRAAGV